MTRLAAIAAGSSLATISFRDSPANSNNGAPVLIRSEGKLHGRTDRRSRLRWIQLPYKLDRSTYRQVAPGTGMEGVRTLSAQLSSWRFSFFETDLFQKPIFGINCYATSFLSVAVGNTSSSNSDR